MVEIRVVVPDAADVDGLMRRLAVLFDRPSVSFVGADKEVRVRSECESRSVVRVVDAVEAWLEDDAAASATLWMGDRSYTLVGPVPATSTR